ncbi:MAG: type II toxin-antitoxin system RelE/ParE family toxin [Deltaproteobacteria bacterium]|nr:type II toxin-antitoxin system RelE/ParE family toxin [Deltaproteobacteria bacterium]
MKYELRIRPAARRALEALPRQALSRVDGKILALAGEPRPHGCGKLAGSADRYRIRVGEWRVVYAIDDPAGVVSVLAVGHRREVYR